ncbi:MAG: MotA/TolQ/ExbB proton channel [Planctomycetaceae bacterium]|nr:MotA/TolQ/ExbB proton channel [Planctomycetaceae bacterium]
MNSVPRPLRFQVWLWFLMVVIAAVPCVTLQAQEHPDATAAEASADAATPHVQQSQLYWIIHTSGWIGGVLLLISFYFVALVTQLFLELRERVVAPPELLSECGTLLSKRDYNGVYRLAKDSETYLGGLIAAGLAAYSTGLGDSREAIDRQGEAITVEMERRISMLAVIGSLGPMIGLLGTLKGMIASFSVIATSDAQMKASEVAGGISEALLITFEGVALSVPAIYFFAVFKNRVSTLTVQTINTADEFIRRFHGVVQSKPAASTTATHA